MPLDWATEVEAVFPVAGALTKPHRWINAGEESFGRWLLEVRKELLAGRSIDLRGLHRNAKWIELDGNEDHQRRLAAGLAAPPQKDGKVIILADSMNKAAQRGYASQIPGAVVAEAVDPGDLVEFARGFDLSHANALERIARYLENVMTNFSAEGLLARLVTIDAGRERTPASDIELAALAFRQKPTYSAGADFAGAIASTGGVRVHRPAMLSGFYQTLRQCQSQDTITPLEAATTVRERSRTVGRPLAKRTVRSTLLLKGLEAEVSVILDIDRMDARHFYVASTRGSMRLVICSHHQHVPVS